jgi:hypothetical protein
LRSGWVSDLNGEEPPEALRLLSERLNPDNYKFATRDGKRVAVSFDWSEEVKQKNQEDLQRIATDQTITSFSFRCRQWLDSNVHIAQAQLPQFWEFAQSIEGLAPRLARDDDPLQHIEDLLCGAIAVLIVKHHDWLMADLERMAWCREKLEFVVRSPPAPLRFDSAGARWRPEMGFLRRRGRRRASCRRPERPLGPPPRGGQRPLFPLQRD